MTDPIEYVLINCINQAKSRCNNSDNWLDHWANLSIADKYKQIRIELINHNFDLHSSDRCVFASVLGMINMIYYKASVNVQVTYLIPVLNEEADLLKEETIKEINKRNIINKLNEAITLVRRDENIKDELEDLVNYVKEKRNN